MAVDKVDKKANLDKKKGPLSDDNKPQAETANPPRQEDIHPDLGDTRGINVPNNQGGVKEPPSY